MPGRIVEVNNIKAHRLKISTQFTPVFCVLLADLSRATRQNHGLDHTLVAHSPTLSYALSYRIA